MCIRDRIPAGAFGCSTADEWMAGLTQIEIPEGITVIGNNAFAGNNFTQINIPSTVKEIGNYAFSTKNYLKDTVCTVSSGRPGKDRILCFQE